MGRGDFGTADLVEGGSCFGSASAVRLENFVSLKLMAGLYSDNAGLHAASVILTNIRDLAASWVRS